MFYYKPNNQASKYRKISDIIYITLQAIIKNQSYVAANVINIAQRFYRYEKIDFIVFKMAMQLTYLQTSKMATGNKNM